MTTQQLDATTLIGQIRDQVAGQVITPDDDCYDAARAVFFGDLDAQPAVIVRAANAADVARVIGVARETGLELAVRSGGHSGAGHGTTDGGILLDLHDLKGLEIDVDGRTAWAESGLTAAEYTYAVGAHGLATGFGDTGSVGLGGITLGGGVGFLSRKHGLTIDSLLAAEIVTAEGQIVQVDAENHADLFWAIRGGGGNFGVVTRFKFRLHPVEQIVGGMLILPATPAVVASFMAEAEAAGDELTTIANVMPCPPMPFVADESHGQLIIMALMVYAGDIEQGEQVIERFRRLATPIADMIRPMPYSEMYPPEDDDYHPTAVSRTMFVNTVDEAEAGTILEWLAASDASVRVAQLRVLGGAIARVSSEATAYAHRTSPIMINVAAFYEGPVERIQREAWVNDFSAVLDQGDAGAYVNFIGREGDDRVRAAYSGDTWDRLVAVKGQYDPTNLFRLNQNIRPAA
jgi:FAD/FMN-containing dehydrogenase